MDANTLDLAKKQADICRVFGNANRILILWSLVERAMSVSEIASAIGSSLQNTSQHLRLMKDKGVLSSRREGSTVYYQIECGDFTKDCRVLLLAQQRTMNDKPGSEERNST